MNLVLAQVLFFVIGSALWWTARTSLVRALRPRKAKSTAEQLDHMLLDLGWSPVAFVAWAGVVPLALLQPVTSIAQVRAPSWVLDVIMLPAISGFLCLLAVLTTGRPWALNSARIRQSGRAGRVTLWVFGVPSLGGESVRPQEG